MANRTIRRPDITPQAVVDLYRAGKTMPEIAAELRCSSRTVLKRLQKAKEPIAPRGKTKKYPLLPEDKTWKRRNREIDLFMDRIGAKVRYAVKTGRLIRPEICESCGIPQNEPPQAAHENYYLPFVVRWLCRSCHMIWDRQNPKSNRLRPVLKEGHTHVTHNDSDL